MSATMIIILDEHTQIITEWGSADDNRGIWEHYKGMTDEQITQDINETFPGEDNTNLIDLMIAFIRENPAGYRG